MHGAEMRIAETRAVNRALRKAYGIGICSVEELGSVPALSNGSGCAKSSATRASSNGHHPLRDRLNLLIRKHRLNPALVKLYAAEFCGTQTLRDASRELVEDFVSTLSKRAAEELPALLCHLNSYQKPEVHHET